MAATTQGPVSDRHESSGSLEPQKIPEVLLQAARDSINPRWVTVQEQQAGEKPINIVSFNMLAQGAIRREIFHYCSSFCLKWKYRRAKLLEELSLLVGAKGDADGRPADILCLQEVDDQFYQSFWAPKLQEMGFKGEMLPKGYPDHNKGAHGCAIFWRDDRFEVLGYDRVDFRTIAEGTVGVEHEELSRAGVGQLLLLRVRGGDPSKGVAISNTHLYWNPRYEYVRVRQAFLMVERMCELLRTHNDVCFAPFFCGDHNATPDTFCYDLLTRRITSGEDDPRWHRLLLPAEHFEPGSNDLNTVVQESNDGTLVEKPLNRPIETEGDRKRVNDAQQLVGRATKELPLLRNPYDGYAALTGQRTHEPSGVPPHTTVGVAWSGTLDYLFYPKSQVCPSPEGSGELLRFSPVRVDALLRVPDADVLKVQGGLPNDWRGSDHVPVGISFSFEE
jgi:mRNA deadenylase 3'-5' endonuclease subunit Ccr4